MAISPREEFLAMANAAIPLVMIDPMLHGLYDAVVYTVHFRENKHMTIEYFGCDADGEEGEGLLCNRNLHGEMAYYGEIHPAGSLHSEHRRVKQVKGERHFGDIIRLFTITHPLPKALQRKNLELIFKDYLKKE